MFSKLGSFISRHRRKFVVGGLVVGGAVLATTYAQRKILEWQEKQAHEFFEKIQRESHFKSTEWNCTQTICSVAATLKETILKLVDADEVLRQIRAGEGNRQTLWNTLKLLVFTQLSTLLYAGLMIVTVLRIQLNVLGGYVFRDKMDSNGPGGPSPECQEHYLSLCNYFVNQGVKDLCSIIKKHVRIVLSKVSLKEKLSVQDLEQIFWRIHSSVSQDPLDPLKHLSKYLLQPFPPQSFEGNDAHFIKKIFYETTEILDSPCVVEVVQTNIKRCYSNTVERYTASCNPDNGATAGNGLTQTPLAKIVPIIHDLAKGPPKNGQLDPWIEQYVVMEDLNTLGANLYEAFSHPQASK